MDSQSPPKKTTKTKQGSSKIDPSFKSKRYRDKLRTEVKALEGLIPVDRPTLHRKLDSQTVYRLVIAFLRIKNYFKSVSTCPGDHVQNHVQSNTRADVQTDVRGPTDVSSKCRQIEEKICKEINIVELIEGFILMLSVDGTIMYVSENVVHFNGFNQVDLIHRCIYGIVHPDDQHDIRNILEQNGRYSYHNAMGLHTARKAQKMSTSFDDASTAVSFFCRLKCFVGNTAGYMKIHCSGKMHTIQNVPRCSKTSDRIAILYCQPFIYNGNDVINEPKDKVFWSKHDLDLTFRETEHKIMDILGYEETELCGVSMYQLVHVEDLHTLVTVHKSMTEVSDVQSFFVRMKHKDNSWIWLHSKGKVISKNSKKFSVVFTHCPIRDENSAFLQQEMLLRRKHGIHDLMNLSKFGGCHGNHVTETEDFRITTHKRCKTSHPLCCSQHGGTRGFSHPLNKCKSDTLNNDPDYCDDRNEEVSVIMNPMTFVPVLCPSTWHANTDRHSPVVPSSHVAHKICLKEKQLQYAQFKRSQQPYRDLRQHHSGHDIHVQYNQQIVQNEHSTGFFRDTMFQDTNTDLYRQSLYLYNIGPPLHSQQSHSFEMGSLDQHCIGGQDLIQLPPQHTSFNPLEMYNYPPSPPPSPRRYMSNMDTYTNTNTVFHSNNVLPGDYNPSSVSHAPMQTRQNTALYFSNDENNAGLVLNEKNVKLADSKPLQHYRSRANIKFSMVLNSPRTPNHGPNGDVPNDRVDMTRYHDETTKHSHSNNVTVNPVKLEPVDSQSCSLNTCTQFVKTPHDCVHYDVEASIHMKIVESELKTSQSYRDLEIPTFDSFMDYLTDEKIY